MTLLDQPQRVGASASHHLPNPTVAGSNHLMAFIQYWPLSACHLLRDTFWTPRNIDLRSGNITEESMDLVWLILDRKIFVVVVFIDRGFLIMFWGGYCILDIFFILFLRKKLFRVIYLLNAKFTVCLRSQL